MNATSTTVDCVDVLIIGAGPSGTVLASLLVDSGLNVLVVERAQFPRFAVGESLLPQCLDVFEKAGMLDVVKAHAFQYKNGAVFEKGLDNRAEFDFSDAFTPGFGWAYQVKRAPFDKVLADEAARKGVMLRFGTQVDDVQFDADHLDNGDVACLLRDDQGQPDEVRARFVVDASGPAQVLAKQLGLTQLTEQTPRSASVTHLRLKPGAQGFDENKVLISLHPEDPDRWYWLIPFEDGTASVGFVGLSDWMEALEAPGETREQRYQQIIRENPSVNRLVDVDDLYMPVGYIKHFSSKVERLYGERFALVGNSGDFLDPIFSSGIAIGLKSAELCAPLIVRFLNGANVDWAEEYQKPVRDGIDVFKAYVNAWYEGAFQKIIFSPVQPKSIREMVCSILAGYAWDQNNPLVNDCQKRLAMLLEMCNAEMSA